MRTSRRPYFVSVQFRRDRFCNCRPVMATELPTRAEALRHARLTAYADSCGALAFRKAADRSAGIYDDGEVLAAYGEVDLSALART